MLLFVNFNKTVLVSNLDTMLGCNAVVLGQLWLKIS